MCYICGVAETQASFNNFYLDAVRGRKSAEAFNALMCLWAVLQKKTEDYFKAYDLTGVQFNVLLLVRHAGSSEGLSQNEIGRHMIVTPSNITRLIDRMVENGLVIRTVSGSDRRVNLVKITDKGVKLLDEAWHGYGEMIQQSVYVLERKDVEQLADLLLKWFARINPGEDADADKRV